MVKTSKNDTETLRLGFASKKERLWAKNRSFYSQTGGFDVKLIKRKLIEIENSI